MKSWWVAVVVVAAALVLFPSSASAKQVTKFLVVGANGRSVSLGGGWSLYEQFQIFPSVPSGLGSARIANLR
jgi:hypothetical protein